ncbi:hypothetical protein Efla_001722 [Eimeria flavescens]
MLLSRRLAAPSWGLSAQPRASCCLLSPSARLLRQQPLLQEGRFSFPQPIELALRPSPCSSPGSEIRVAFGPARWGTGEGRLAGSGASFRGPLLPSQQQTRCITYHPQRRVVGHRLEIMPGKHRKRRLLPPKVPVHPSVSAAATVAARAAPGATPPAAPQQDMTLFEAYRDLQLRWKRTTRQSRKKFCIARKWRQHLACRPQPEPAWLLFLHPQMGLEGGPQGAPRAPEQPQRRGRRRALSSQQAQLQAAQQPDEQQQQQQCEQSHACEQQKPQMPAEKPQAVEAAGDYVTVGDLVQTEKLHRKQAGDKVVFGTVLLAGTRDWTLLGKPTIPFVKVKGVIEQQTLAGETLSFRYKKTRRASRFLRIRHWVTLIRIEDIVVDTEMQADPPPQPPKRLLDLWANRWLYPEELEGIQVDANGKPIAESIYDGSEHQQGTYHRRGLTACYRWQPDPQATHWKR